MFAAMDKFNEELINAGIMLDGTGLTPSSRGARVRFSGSNRTVTDGPFPETKELIAGFLIWKVSSLQEAIDWVKKCPNPMIEDSDVEIRPLMEPEDFAGRGHARAAGGSERTGSPARGIVTVTAWPVLIMNESLAA